MARKRRRRSKFSPFRVSQRATKSILVGLCAFLMVVFFVPFRGACRQAGRGPNLKDVVATYEGTKIRYGDILDVTRRFESVFRPARRLTRDDATLLLAEYHEARKAGIRVGDPEVVDTIRNQVFPRRVKVQYAIAENAAFASKVTVSDDEVKSRYENLKDKRFRNKDGTYRPLEAVRDRLREEVRERKASDLARKALEEIRRKTLETVGPSVRGVFERLARSRDLTFNETRSFFTWRQARSALREVAEAPGILERVFTDPIGVPSQPLPIPGGWCSFRVVRRTRGFGPDGRFHPEDEGWVSMRERYDVINTKSYAEVLDELGVTQAELEQTVREDLVRVLIPTVLRDSLLNLPAATLRERYMRDNTKAVAAYFSVEARDFEGSVTYTTEGLRAFYDQHKHSLGAPGRPGYLEPERVAIEYVLGRKDAIAEALPEEQLRDYFERRRSFFPEESFEKAREAVRDRLAEELLMRHLAKIAELAEAERAAGRRVDLAALAAQESRVTYGAFHVRRTPLFAASEAEERAPELRGADLADILFGEKGKRYAVAGTPPEEGQQWLSEDFKCEQGRFFFRVLERRESRALPFEKISEATRRRLVRDYRRDRAATLAREAAEKLRVSVHERAFDQLAKSLGVTPTTTDFLKPASPIRPLGKPIPALYDQLAVGRVGDISDVVPGDGKLLVARLTERDDAKGIKLRVIAIEPKSLEKAICPSQFELEAHYQDDPHAYLPRPKPIPFEKVKDEIVEVLTRRRILDLARGRIEKALGGLVEAKKPDLASLDPKLKLKTRMGVVVNLAKTEATPLIGKAAGFRDAVTALKPGELSRILANSKGRFFFILRSRNEKKAKIDVAVALYADIRREVKTTEKEAKEYYEKHRETAYVTGDEIEPPPSWDELPAEARARVETDLVASLAKKSPAEQLQAIRNSVVLEAFRKAAEELSIPLKRKLPLEVRTIGPFNLSSAPSPFDQHKQAIANLEPGQLSEPIQTERGAVVAFMAAARPGGLARAKVAVFSPDDFLPTVPQPDEASLRRFYEEHKNNYLTSPLVVADYLLAAIEPRAKSIAAALTEEECRRYYDAHIMSGYRGKGYESIKAQVRQDLAAERARAVAEREAREALGALQREPETPLDQLVEKHQLRQGTTGPFPLADNPTTKELGKLDISAAAFEEAKPGRLLPQPVATDKGYAVIRIASIQPPQAKPLAEVKDQVARDARNHAAHQAAAKAAEAFLRAAKASSFDKALRQTKRPPRVIQTALMDVRRFKLPGEGQVPDLVEAVFALEKPGLGRVATDAKTGRAYVAQVFERKPDRLVTLDVVEVPSALLSLSAEGFSEEELRKHYEANRQKYRLPERIQAELLVAPYEELKKRIELSEDELRKEYDRSVKAREPLCRDWSAAPRVAYLPFEKAREKVRDALVAKRARQRAEELLKQAMKDLSGGKTALGDYAKNHPPLKAVESPFFDRERKGLPEIGPAPELAKLAFAAKKGTLLGPVLGLDGGCVFKVIARKPAELPPLADVRARVSADLRRKKALERALRAATDLHKRLSAALEKAKGRRETLRKTVHEQPLEIEIPQRPVVILSRPIYPLRAGQGKSSFISGLGVKPTLVEAIFNIPPGHLTPVVDDPEQRGSYVAALVRFISPEPPKDPDLFMTAFQLQREIGAMASYSWRSYLAERLE